MNIFNNMSEQQINPDFDETVPVSSLALIYDMIRQQKHTSAAAAKKAAAALRAQLHQELENKKMCSYQPHDCTQLTLDGYDYCLRHIMEDKTAPFRQCSYVYNSNGRRCHLPAPKGEKREHVYCTDHAFKCHLTRVRASSKHYPSNSVESLLDSLSHHVSSGPSKSASSKPDDLEDKPNDDYLKVTKHLDPFTEIDASSVLSSRNRILDFGSESESDVEPANYNTVWHDAQAESSDDESIDSENEDVLKHAGIYTAEEVTLVTRDKLIRLQSLYIEQFKHLQHVLKERRRKYLFSLKREKDNLASIHSQPKETPKEKRIYNKLKALNHYHKKHGIDAIMNKKFTELRAKLTDGTTTRPSSFTKCTFSEGGVKCGEKSLPVAKHCRKHILHDRNQVLFKRCSHVQDDFECNESVLGIFKDAMCKYHTDFPPIRHYGETRTFDDSDLEDSSDTHDQHAIEFMASSSCDSRAPATITSNDLMNFSNQFPSSSSKVDMYDTSLRDINITMQDIDNTLDANSSDYLQDVTQDMEGIEEKMANIEDLDVPENFNEMLTENLPEPSELTKEKDEIEEELMKMETNQDDGIKIEINADYPEDVEAANLSDLLKSEIPEETNKSDDELKQIIEAETSKETSESETVKETNESEIIEEQTNKPEIPETEDIKVLKTEIVDEQIKTNETQEIKTQEPVIVNPGTIDLKIKEEVEPIIKQEEIPEIDPDDDLSGIMLEMQKDNMQIPNLN